jgi:hypothetical protein
MRIYYGGHQLLTENKVDVPHVLHLISSVLKSLGRVKAKPEKTEKGGGASASPIKRTAESEKKQKRSKEAKAEEDTKSTPPEVPVTPEPEVAEEGKRRPCACLCNPLPVIDYPP